MMGRMPPQQSRNRRTPVNAPGRGLLCTATTTGGEKCRRQVVPGLTVCKSHGGGTAASVRKSKQAVASQQVATLWGISTDTGSFSVEAALQQLARNKVTDIVALRIELSSSRRHIGLMTASHEVTEAEVADDVYKTIKRKKLSGTSPWVQELHKAETELVAILRLLQDVTGGTDEVDTRRIRMQTAREAARLIKAFPGLGVDEVAAEISKRAS